MKDNLYEILMGLFEKSLTQIQKNQRAISLDDDPVDLLGEEEIIGTGEQFLHIQPARHQATRIFTYQEQMRFTKASYQFLMRMKLWQIIDNESFELIVNQLLASDSRIITLQETKWAIRNVIAANLNEEQLAFLDLVLYQKEDMLTVQ